MIPTPPDREPDLEIVDYLHRWCLTPRNKEGNIYLHHFLQPDMPYLHDHPWSFTSLILNGGYIEATEHGFNTYKRGDTIRKYATDRHYVYDVAPDTWSLVCTGPLERSWGYIVDGKWVSHRVFVPTIRPEVIARGGYYDGDSDG